MRYWGRCDSISGSCRIKSTGLCMNSKIEKKNHLESKVALMTANLYLKGVAHSKETVMSFMRGNTKCYSIKEAICERYVFCRLKLNDKTKIILVLMSNPRKRAREDGMRSRD